MELKRFRDPVSGGTHLAGALLGAVGLIFLVQRALIAGTPRHVAAFAIFGASLVLLYLSSASYHLVPISERARLIFRKIDHCMIFVLIAGSYTPFCLLALKPALGHPMLIAVWTFALGGLFLKIFWLHAPRWVSTAIYLGMGWMSLVIVIPLSRALGHVAMGWLVAGGLTYTAGAVVYALKRPNPFPPVFGFHEIWHLHVLLGSFFHFLSVATLLPPR